MADESNQILESIGVGPLEPTPPIEGGKPLTPEEQAERTHEGRVRKEREEKERVQTQYGKTKAALEAVGWTIDEEGIPVQMTPAYSPPTSAPRYRYEPEYPVVPGDEDDDDEVFLTRKEARALAQTEAQRMVQQYLGAYDASTRPVLDNVVTSQTSTKYSDWPQIGQNVLKRLKTTYGIQSIAQAMSSVPQLVEDLVYSERARLAESGGTDEEKAKRQQLLSAAAGIGGATGASSSGGGGGKTSIFSQEEKQALADAGMTEEEAEKMLYSSAVTPDMFKKKEGK